MVLGQPDECDQKCEIPIWALVNTKVSGVREIRGDTVMGEI